MRNEYLDSLKRTDEMIENLFKIKTLLMESIIKESCDNLIEWKNKKDSNITAVVTGIDYRRKEVRINSTNYSGVVLNYSEFMDRYSIDYFPEDGVKK